MATQAKTIAGDEKTLTFEEKKAKLAELVEAFDNAFLVTHACDPLSNEHYHARPMALAGRDEAGQLWFATAIDTPKVREIEADPQVLVTFQDERRFVTITGRAELVTERAQIEAVWSAPLEVWFPDGKSDPRLVLVKVDVHSAEYWDNSGTAGLKYLFEAAKALVKGERPNMSDQRYHDKLHLGS